MESHPVLEDPRQTCCLVVMPPEAAINRLAIAAAMFLLAACTQEEVSCAAPAEPGGAKHHFVGRVRGGWYAYSAPPSDQLELVRVLSADPKRVRLQLGDSAPAVLIECARPCTSFTESDFQRGHVSGSRKVALAKGSIIDLALSDITAGRLELAQADMPRNGAGPCDRPLPEPPPDSSGRPPGPPDDRGSTSHPPPPPPPEGRGRDDRPPPCAVPKIAFGNARTR